MLRQPNVSPMPSDSTARLGQHELRFTVPNKYYHPPTVIDTVWVTLLLCRIDSSAWWYIDLIYSVLEPQITRSVIDIAKYWYMHRVSMSAMALYCYTCIATLSTTSIHLNNSLRTKCCHCLLSTSWYPMKYIRRGHAIRNTDLATHITIWEHRNLEREWMRGLDWSVETYSSMI